VAAPVRLVLLVDAHVLREVALQLLVADVAMEGLQVAVEASQVLLEGVASVELLPADVADEVPYLQVPVNVQLQVGRAGESRVADGADVGLQSGVRPHVLLQLPPSGEGLGAHPAVVGLVPRVDADVQAQTLLHRKHLVAVVADEDLVDFVALEAGRVSGSHVVLEGARLPEPPVAFLAHVRSLVRVYPQVLPEIVISEESLLANTACVLSHFLFGVSHFVFNGFVTRM
jgi:hypothetical protein